MIRSTYFNIKGGFWGIERWNFDQSTVDSTLAGIAVADSSKKVNGEDCVIMKQVLDKEELSIIFSLNRKNRNQKQWMPVMHKYFH